MTAFLFLNGRYLTNDDALVKRHMRLVRPLPLIVAVDGGITFLQKLQLRPRFWLTDLDSAPRLRKGFLRDTDLVLYPPDKDKTDGELALELCIKQGARRVIVFGWDARAGEIDHLLGNLFLCRTRAARRADLAVEFLDSRRRILCLDDESVTITDCVGQGISVVPLDKTIRLSLTGTAYKASETRLAPGDTLALRNVVTAKRARVTVSGSALVILSRDTG